jgi:hypothetical protein
MAHKHGSSAWYSVDTRKLATHACTHMQIEPVSQSRRVRGTPNRAPRVMLPFTHACTHVHTNSSARVVGVAEAGRGAEETCTEAHLPYPHHPLLRSQTLPSSSASPPALDLNKRLMGGRLDLNGRLTHTPPPHPTTHTHTHTHTQFPQESLKLERFRGTLAWHSCGTP